MPEKEKNTQPVPAAPEAAEVKTVTAPLNANIGIEFSLIGTKLRAMYEKNGDEGYALLLAPSEQEADNAISIGQMVKDIQNLVKGVDANASTEEMEANLQESLSGLGDGGGNSPLDKLYLKLQMAFLYIKKTKTESNIEYAFQLQILSKDVIPKEIQSLVNVEYVSISVWNTSRKKVVERMALETVSDYLGETAQPALSENAEATA